MVRTNANGRVFHGEDSARTAIGLWRDGDIFIVRSTGATWVRTDGAWLLISAGEVSGVLPDGVLDGDIIRWNSGDSQWEATSEPFVMSSGQIILTPALVAALDVEGGIFYKSTDKSVYVCTDI